MFNPRASFAQCEVIRLEPPEHLSGDAFGASIDIQGDRIIVGAPSWWGEEDRPGYADIFRKHKGTWRHEARLSSPGGHPEDWFGRSVLLVKDLAIITAPNDRDGRNNVFAMYVFKRTGREWKIRERLLLPGPLAATSLASDGRRLVVGFAFPGSGVYVYRFQGKKLVYEQELLTSSHSGGFTGAVAIEGDRIIAGHSGENPAGISYAGSAFIFRFDPTTESYLEEAQLLPAGSYPRYFGITVGIDGDVAMVGQDSFFDDVQVFQADGDQWSLKQHLRAPNIKGFSTALVLKDSTALLASYHCEPNELINVECIPGIAFRYRGDPETGAWYREYPLRIDVQYPEINIFNFKARSIAMDGDVAVLGAPETDIPVQNAGAAFVFTGLNSLDANFNDRPDSCDVPGDVSGDGLVNVTDLLTLLAAWGPCTQCPADLDRDEVVNVNDLLSLLSNWN